MAVFDERKVPIGTIVRSLAVEQQTSSCHGPGELHHTFQDVEELPEWQAQRTRF